MVLTLTSPAFAHNESIPTRYTCDGDDISPALHWSGIPDNTRSLVLIVDDPDAPDPRAPQRTWVHWLVYNLPPDLQTLPEGIRPTQLHADALEGNNDWHHNHYNGPCPPVGRHRYFFKLYALDLVLPPMSGLTKPVLLASLKGHVLAVAELVGTYEKL